ncbi:MAG: hypothetical protein A2W90_15360 [Bacteroidetes bacterium GWF2_42_66]|nr:MAG: hypothetical protein A2W92_07140 [Bacteroidetes bacterium GWA2_42_15]OFX96960.1 MAG: hypothetical protein A2W89_19855 [Bacteroidetes bacterium GWE2_42_39]OFY46874.1 MAG: hypothetical protein A2W90_15360 [Bacteroidetes bacterium GWF2_42_66]
MDISASTEDNLSPEQQIFKHISPNFGKSVGVFGGSLSAMEASKTAKNIWSEKLNLKVFTYGRGGAGFGIQEANPQNNMVVQAEGADVHDIYILWASTNDHSKKIPVGEVRSNDLNTQAGGIRKSVEILQTKNPDAKIYFFTSLPMFKTENTLDEYVKGQKAVCADLHIPVLDQFYTCGFNQWNAPYFYREDLKHLTEKGYTRIAEMQVAFLANPLSGNF